MYMYNNLYDKNNLHLCIYPYNSDYNSLIFSRRKYHHILNYNMTKIHHFLWDMLLLLYHWNNCPHLLLKFVQPNKSDIYYFCYPNIQSHSIDNLIQLMTKKWKYMLNRLLKYLYCILHYFLVIFLHLFFVHLLKK